jgi:hypothetical protein
MRCHVFFFFEGNKHEGRKDEKGMIDTADQDVGCGCDNMSISFILRNAMARVVRNPNNDTNKV